MPSVQTWACWKALRRLLNRDGRTKSQPLARKASSPPRSGSLRRELSLIIILGSSPPFQEGHGHSVGDHVNTSTLLSCFWIFTGKKWPMASTYYVFSFFTRTTSSNFISLPKPELPILTNIQSVFQYHQDLLPSCNTLIEKHDLQVNLFPCWLHDRQSVLGL